MGGAAGLLLPAAVGQWLVAVMFVCVCLMLAVVLFCALTAAGSPSTTPHPYHQHSQQHTTVGSSRPKFGASTAFGHRIHTHVASLERGHCTPTNARHLITSSPPACSAPQRRNPRQSFPAFSKGGPLVNHAVLTAQHSNSSSANAAPTNAHYTTLPSRAAGSLPLPFRLRQQTGMLAQGDGEAATANEVSSLESDMAGATAAFGVALAFCAGIWYKLGTEPALDFASGYVVEQSLSVDNLIVFLALFELFRIPMEFQPRILSWGLLGAVVMRGLMVYLGAALLSSFRPVLLVFAAILLYSAYKMLAESFADDDDEEDTAFAEKVVDQIGRVLPVTEQFDGDRFFTEGSSGSMATPMLLCLVCIELSDVIFAVDSVPAVFAITEDPFIVLTSNLCAILGLRSIYGLLSRAVSSLEYLSPAVSLVLGFVGAKIGAEYFGFEVSTPLSLSVIVSLLGAGVVASYAIPPKSS